MHHRRDELLNILTCLRVVLKWKRRTRGDFNGFYAFFCLTTQSWYVTSHFNGLRVKPSTLIFLIRKATDVKKATMAH